ncbi:alpha/beta fold hydrolase [Streptacidiphilus sp. 4-A2]|nr:alpha/beta fold hydrolase [Streptacidiphilus sp. 4-A2]
MPEQTRQGRSGSQWSRSRWTLATATAATMVALCGAAAPSASAQAQAQTQARPVGGPARAGAVAQQPADILDAPTQVADTALGQVGYRTVGHGSPLLLINGLGTSMDDWAPSFVDALAAHHRVVVFDNAGVGGTAALPQPLTVSGMADQTSALISTLRLGRPAVLGWSMGGMIAQALAVRHPGQVSALVLAATQAGTGFALPIPAAAAAELNSPDPAVVLSVLFPPDQTAAAIAYAEGVVRYPDRYTAPAAVRSAQNLAIQQWMAGQDPAGRRTGRLRVPTLVAGGTLDQLDPAANDLLLAQGVPGARLLLFPDAGHAFLFQDTATFVPAVERFLRGSRW